MFVTSTLPLLLLAVATTNAAPSPINDAKGVVKRQTYAGVSAYHYLHFTYIYQQKFQLPIIITDRIFSTVTQALTLAR